MVEVLTDKPQDSAPTMQGSSGSLGGVVEVEDITPLRRVLLKALVEVKMLRNELHKMAGGELHHLEVPKAAPVAISPASAGAATLEHIAAARVEASHLLSDQPQQASNQVQAAQQPQPEMVEVNLFANLLYQAEESWSDKDPAQDIAEEQDTATGPSTTTTIPWTHDATYIRDQQLTSMPMLLKSNSPGHIPKSKLRYSPGASTLRASLPHPSPLSPNIEGQEHVQLNMSALLGHPLASDTPMLGSACQGSRTRRVSRSLVFTDADLSPRHSTASRSDLTLSSAVLNTTATLRASTCSQGFETGQLQAMLNSQLEQQQHTSGLQHNNLLFDCDGLEEEEVEVEPQTTSSLAQLWHQHKWAAQEGVACRSSFELAAIQEGPGPGRLSKVRGSPNLDRDTPRGGRAGLPGSGPRHETVSQAGGPSWLKDLARIPSGKVAASLKAWSQAGHVSGTTRV